MFRSMTTTSGASSRDELDRLRAVRRLADDLHALLLEQVAEPGAEEVVVVDEQHAELASSPPLLVLRALRLNSCTLALAGRRPAV